MITELIKKETFSLSLSLFLEYKIQRLNSARLLSLLNFRKPRERERESREEEEKEEETFLASRYLSPSELENNGGRVSRFHAYPDSNRSNGMERIVRTQSNSF